MQSREVNRRFALVALSVAALFTSCQPSTATKPRPPVESFESPDKSLREGARETSNGRYQMVSTPTKLLKLDTATGQTWFLDADSVWKPLANADSTENKARIIAEFVAQSLIATKTYNQNTGRLDAVTKAQEKEMVDAAVKQAFDAYEHPKTAEQYLRKIQ